MLDENDDVQSPVLGRRQILRTAGAMGILGLIGRRAIAQSAAGVLAAPAEIDFSDLVDDARFQAVCTLTPSQTAGPFYLNLNLLRQDITEGLPGLPTRVFIHVVRTSDCSPVPNATVDLWHADAIGRYSGFASQGTAGMTFLRGIQVTDASGNASFDTIYPGWYPGRTAHMHLKVRPTPTSELTTQLYFLQRLTTRVYLTPAYIGHGPAPTTNATDGLFDPQLLVSILGATSSLLQIEITIGIP